MAPSNCFWCYQLYLSIIEGGTITIASSLKSITIVYSLKFKFIQVLSEPISRFPANFGKGFPKRPIDYFYETSNPFCQNQTIYSYLTTPFLWMVEADLPTFTIDSPTFLTNNNVLKLLKDVCEPNSRISANWEAKVLYQRQLMAQLCYQHHQENDTNYRFQSSSVCLSF
ncbi:hypothetical protein ACTA71_001230 [Dictyostelium dimigraforme]